MGDREGGRKVVVVILSEAKDLLAPEPDFGLKGFFVSPCGASSE